ncbi:Vta1p KNAG_0C00640 [Huiozyma naganishii CBS 8797]|uniref:Vta1 C-terminal domain-containing protein n=1 Tax=Huiozyma naganishii (strain ATCC MYA-139 / BCRC 22969 / CBS 8797 / KCTC 17520 / NBRC 10181 / NCYC 3082 / Yp74L-3) TaxID=1071383 RepID=J7RI06_HUIN7|nr:hypothetical protein KNAG_0C00640 [Kazachstania naganishii CBS 8797]CCK69178.1 hypothetical protein KNAG_0C00640 [Kazachstania naganishii CBS 8797]
MIDGNTVNRVLRTAKQFDVAGLGVISYYMKLYVVEEILTERDRSEESTAIASELLDAIETFKSAVMEHPEDPLRTLFEDQEKGRLYMLNFTMSLYNNKLQQVSEGPWDHDLRRGLWCCVDLYSSILHLWKNSPEEVRAIRQRIKYCKVHLSKLAKGELGPAVEAAEEHIPQNDKEVDEMIDAALRETASEGTAIEQELQGEPDTGKTAAPDANDEDIDRMLAELNKLSPSVGESTDGKGAASEQTPISGESVKTPSGHASTPEPVFLDSEEEEEKEESPKPKPVAAPEGKKSKKIPALGDHYNRQDLDNIMDRGTKIERVQRLAKFTVSALNYEDISTAKAQLTEALELLNTL